METRLGIFDSISQAEQALEDLVKRDLPRESLILLSPQSPTSSGIPASTQASLQVPEREFDKVAGPGTAPSGAGKASGEAIGVTIGGTAGFAAGATIASLMVPGLGLIFATGAGAAALLGLGGAAAGAKVGDTLEKNADMGFPPDEVAFYRRLLRQGKSLVIAKVRSGADISTVQEVFRQRGTEDVDVARQQAGKAA